MSLLKNIKIFYNAVAGNPETRYEAHFEILRYFCKKAGFRLYNKNLIWDKDIEYIEAWNRFPESNDFVHDRHYTLYNLAKSVSYLSQDTAECGVFKGASSHLILEANRNNNKTHHIFDSFSGLSKPTKDDAPVDTTSRMWKKNELSVTEDIVRHNLHQFSNIEIHKGWIPECFNNINNKTYSFVHIDVDLYEPTKDCLNFFYDQIAPGGLMVCDDYGYTTCPGTYKAFNEFISDKPENIAHLPVGSAFIIKQ